MPNIQFDYLYRDGSNYKNYSFVIFENPDQIDLKPLDILIKSKLIGGQFFFVTDWQLLDLHFDNWDEQLDHNWHEFESMEFTDKPSNTLLKLAVFVSLIENTNWAY